MSTVSTDNSYRQVTDNAAAFLLGATSVSTIRDFIAPYFANHAEDFDLEGVEVDYRRAISDRLPDGFTLNGEFVFGPAGVQPDWRAVVERIAAINFAAIVERHQSERPQPVNQDNPGWPVDDSGPVWADEVTSWQQTRPGWWQRTFIGDLGGARVSQVQGWDGKEVAFSDFHIIRRGPSCPGWCAYHVSSGTDEPAESTVHGVTVDAGDLGEIIIEQDDDGAPMILIPQVNDVILAREARDLGIALIQADALVRR